MVDPSGWMKDPLSSLDVSTILAARFTLWGWRSSSLEGSRITWIVQYKYSWRTSSQLHQRRQQCHSRDGFWWVLQSCVLHRSTMLIGPSLFPYQWRTSPIVRLVTFFYRQYAHPRPWLTKTNYVDLAKTSPHILHPERFALHLGTFFVSKYAHIHKAFVTIEKLRWQRIAVQEGEEAKEHPYSFFRDGDDERITNVEVRFRIPP